MDSGGGWITSSTIAFMYGAASALTCSTSAVVVKSVKITPPSSLMIFIARSGSLRETRRAIVCLHLLGWTGREKRFSRGKA